MVVQPPPNTFHPEEKVFCLPLPRIYTHTHMHRHACENTDDACSQQRHSTHTHSEKTTHIGQKKERKKKDRTQASAVRPEEILLLLPGLVAAVWLDAVPQVCTPALSPPPHVLISAFSTLRRTPRRMPCCAPRGASIGPTAVPKLTMKHAAAKPCCLCTLKWGGGGEEKNC